MHMPSDQMPSKPFRLLTADLSLRHPAFAEL